MNTIELFFWIFLSIVVYTHIGYGVLLLLAVKCKELVINKKKSSANNVLPQITLLIAAYNEEDVVKMKMENIHSLNYPERLLEVVWVTDGSNDKTNELLSFYKDLRVLHQPERLGKTAAINRAVKFIDNPIIVFTDANTQMNSEALLEIAAAFEIPSTGCVAGEKRVFSDSGNISSAGEGLYWKYESKLKELDSRLFSAVGAAGELFAIRRELFEEVDSDTLLDDFIISMNVLKRGYRIRYCKSAYATEKGSLNLKEEKKRKIRISAGGLQAVLRLGFLLNFFKYHIFTFQYLSHRVFRWTIAPIAIVALIPLNIILAINPGSPFYIVLLVLHVLFYVLAYIGISYNPAGKAGRLLIIPYYFLFMHYNVFSGIAYLIRKKRGDGSWEKAKRQNA
ncbi:MAG TPA: glycosyl transferase [Rikenellaceae bacterium]|nr:glycosyl transferase [Rikenellaceae bacterium]